MPERRPARTTAIGTRARRSAARLAIACGAWSMLAASGAAPALAQDSIVVASTTSTEQSGLFKHLLPAFQAAAGIEVRVVALGTGQALDTARRGDADVVLVHDPEAEAKFVAEGWGIGRRPVMYNDFVIVGPATDPAGIRGSTDVTRAMRAIAAARAPFVSRGDRSGTHALELRLWKASDVQLPASGADWYKEAGSGMGPTLNMASGLSGYTITDRGTWLAFRNRGPLQVLVQGDRRLFNQYSVMLVNPARHPHVKQAAGMRFADWLVSPAGQASIAAYTIEGQQLFFPNAASGPAQ